MPTASTSQDLLTSKLSMLIFAFFDSFKSLSTFQGTFKLPCSQPSTLLLVRGGGREGGRERERGREGGRERWREGGREGGEGLETNEGVLFIIFLTPCSNDLLSLLSITSVRSGIYHLLGVLCEQFPEHLVKIAPRLIDIYMTNLKTEVK